MRFRWISWCQPTEDVRPLGYPPNDAVLGWWCTGRTAGGDGTLCALVNAATDEEAEAAILHDWPEAGPWRFCEARNDCLLGDRFPLKPWMQQRIAAI